MGWAGERQKSVSSLVKYKMKRKRATERASNGSEWRALCVRSTEALRCSIVAARHLGEILGGCPNREFPN